MAAKAICMSCGAAKAGSAKPCDACGFAPGHDDVALAKSHILSVERYRDGTDRKQYASELEVLGARIRAGESVSFDAAEVARFASLIRRGRETSAFDSFKMFARAMLSLAPLWIIVALGIVLLCRRC